MTQEQFLNGEIFRIKNQSLYVGAPTFCYKNGSIIIEHRSSIDEQVLTSNYHCNVECVMNTGFTGFTFVMGNEVKVKFDFEDLILFGSPS